MRICLTASMLAYSAVAAALPPLPRAISGQCAGVSNGALLVIGGSYFPTPLFEGGTKTWVDTIHVLTPGAAAWKTFRAPRAIGYAACATTRDGVAVAGGGDAQSSFREAFRVVWSGGRPDITALAPLPEPVVNGAATAVGGAVYVLGGQSLFVLDGDVWKKLEDCPGPSRILPVFGTVDGRLYLASGAHVGADGRRTYLSDAWEYQPGRGWKQLADVASPLVAAPVLSRRDRIYAFGGDDGANAARIQELKDAHPGFSRRILAWSPLDRRWSSAGDYPAGLVTTMAVDWSGHVVIAGGEDRPGHRSAEVVSIPLEKLP